VQAQKHGIVEREKEMVLQLRKLSTKIRGIKNSPPNERMIYSLQCAIQVLEEERQSFVQKREYIDRDMALMRDKQFYEQAKIDAILDLALTSVGLLPPQDDNNSEEGIVPRSRRPSQTSFNRPTLANLGLEFFVFGEDQTPLQTIIEQRRLHVQAAQERLSSQKECLKHCRAAWKLEHDRGEDDRSEASFEKDHGQHVQLLKHELEIAYEGYRCLADAEKALGMEEGMIRVPEIRILRSESIVRELAEFYEARMDSHRR
jgi:hypothetical protein